jgi:hypothetical protein
MIYVLIDSGTVRTTEPGTQEQLTTFKGVDPLTDGTKNLING